MIEQPPPAGRPQRLPVTIGAVIAAGAVLALAVGYAVIGFAVAQVRIVGADSRLNTVISHQNQLNTTFHDIDTKFSALNSGAAFNPTQARSVIDQFVANARAAGQTVDKDDASLASAQSSLNDQPWLTAINRPGLDREARRIAHARKALSNARAVAADYVLDGQFLQAFMDTIIDLDALDRQTSAGDFTGAKATVGTMKAHVDKATQLSTAPGLPQALHSLMVDFQSLVSDFGNLLDAAQAGDDTALATYEQNVQNDSNRISAYNFDQMSADIDAFYKPLVDGFNSEMKAATA